MENNDLVFKDMPEETAFIRTDEGKHHFIFRCGGCKTFGTLEVPIQTRQFTCPEECGAVYVLWFDSLKKSPALKCVVCPVFADDDEEVEF